MKEIVAALSCLAATCQALAGAMELDLSGRWRLSGRDRWGRAIEFGINVPGDVHTALYEASRAKGVTYYNCVMKDPYWGQNEIYMQWIGRSEWTVSREFEVEELMLGREEVVLRLEDVDTFAEIFINGRRVGSTSNRFRRWEFDVKSFLVAGKNTIEGRFRSAELEADKLARKYTTPHRMACVPWAKN